MKRTTIAEDNRRLDERHKAILEAGEARARAGAPAKPEYAGHELGSWESSVFYDGYAKGCPGFRNPYRQHEQ